MSTIQTTVKTEKKAKYILRQKGVVSFTNKVSECECGETNSINGTTKKGETYNVAYCESCGSDHAFRDEVIIKL